MPSHGLALWTQITPQQWASGKAGGRQGPAWDLGRPGQSAQKVPAVADPGAAWGRGTESQGQGGCWPPESQCLPCGCGVQRRLCRIDTECVINAADAQLLRARLGRLCRKRILCGKRGASAGRGVASLGRGCCEEGRGCCGERRGPCGEGRGCCGDPAPSDHARRAFPPGERGGQPRVPWSLTAFKGLCKVRIFLLRDGSGR